MGRRLLLLTEEVRDMKKDLQDMQVGDTFFFGDYHGGIEWRVLEKTPDSLLVISEYGLDAKPFDEEGNTNEWNKCSLKKWLNSAFYNRAFDSEEKSLIENTSYGKVFLLSIEEAEKYFSSDSDRKCKPTSYALSQGAATYQGIAWWWLRSHYLSRSYGTNVSYNGCVHHLDYSVDYAAGCVRPAMRLVINFV